MGQAKVMSHLVCNGGGEANRAAVMILEQKHTLHQKNNHCALSVQMRCRSGVPTWLTPPEFSVHMANLFASPTVSPSKSLPLWREDTSGQTGTHPLFKICSHFVDSRHKLGRVVFHPLQEVGPPPEQEVVQSRLRVDVNVNEVLVRPHLQAHQQDSDIERSIQLSEHEPNVSLATFFNTWASTWTHEFTWSMWFMTSKIRGLVWLPYRWHWGGQTK